MRDHIEGRKREEEQECVGNDHHWLAAEPIRRPAADEIEGDAENADDHRGPERNSRVHVQGVDGIGGHIFEGVVADRARQQHHQAEERDAQIGAERHRRLVRLFIQRLGQVTANIEAEGNDGRADEECRAPTPIRERIRG